MNVRFIDTSIILNLLKIPSRCDKAQEVLVDFEEAVNNGDNLILPLASIIETGNHIAHITDGNLRRSIAGKFASFIRASLENNAPWFYDDCELSKEDLIYIADNFSQKAMEGVGIGDKGLHITVKIPKSCLSAS